MVCVSSSCIHLDVGSCPCYPYRRLTQGSKVFPDPAKADERITLNLIICEIHSHIETFKCKMLTKVWNGINSFIVYRISSSAVAPSLFICTHTDVHYVPRRKEHKGLFFFFILLVLIWGKKTWSLTCWRAQSERQMWGSLSYVPPSPPRPLDFCFHPITTSCASSGKRTLLVCHCRHWSSFFPLL